MIKDKIDKNQLDKAQEIALYAISNLNFVDESVIRKLVAHQVKDKLYQNAMALAKAMKFNSRNSKLINNIFSEIIYHMLENENLDKTVDTYIEIYREHHITPASYVLIKRLIKENNFERLNEVMDVNVDIHGKNNTLVQCAFGFIETENVHHASEIFKELQKTGPKENIFIRQKIDSYFDKNNLDLLSKTLIASFGNISNADRDYLYEKILLILCRRGGDVNEILEKCEAMIDETLKPSKKTLNIVQKYLKQNGSLLPKEWLDEANLSPEGINRDLEIALNEDRLDDARIIIFDALQNEKGQVLRRILRFFLKKCSEMGDVNTFDALREYLDEWARREIQFYKYETIAHTKSQIGMEMIEKWKNQFNEADEKTLKELIKMFPLEFYDLLSGQPDLMEECK